MDITPLSAVRIAGEVGLAGGTITGGTYAVKYGQQVTVVTGERDKAIAAKQPAESKNVNLGAVYTQISAYWEQIKNEYSGSYKDGMDTAMKQMEKTIGISVCSDDCPSR